MNLKKIVYSIFPNYLANNQYYALYFLIGLKIGVLNLSCSKNNDLKIFRFTRSYLKCYPRSCSIYNPSTFCKILPTFSKKQLLEVIFLSLSKMHVLTRSCKTVVLGYFWILGLILGLKKKV